MLKWELVYFVTRATAGLAVNPTCSRPAYSEAWRIKEHFWFISKDQLFLWENFNTEVENHFSQDIWQQKGMAFVTSIGF